MKYMKNMAPIIQKKGLIAISQNIEYKHHNPIYLNTLEVIVALCAGKSYIFLVFRKLSVTEFIAPYVTR